MQNEKTNYRNGNNAKDVADSKPGLKDVQNNSSHYNRISDSPPPVLFLEFKKKG